MPDAPARNGGLQHAAFLEYATRHPDAASTGFGQAAFLVLRLVDLLATSGSGLDGKEALFEYQASATSRYCTEQLEPGPMADLLLDVVRAAKRARRRRNPTPLAQAMLTLSESLEANAHYVEALDVLQTLEACTGDRLGARRAIATTLLAARIQRKMAHFTEAEAAYDRAAARARSAGDQRSVLLARLGRANVYWGQGNLPEAERWNRDALADARALADRDVEARAEHGLGNILGARGQFAEAVQHLWRAYKLYDGSPDALLALGDVGFNFARLGSIENAERALTAVVKRSRHRHSIQNAQIELMDCASCRRDRVGFERWRSEAARALPQMAPNILADYHLKQGIGLARFGQLARGEVELTRALRVARMNGLHEFEFRIERVRAGLSDCAAPDLVEGDTVAEPGARTPGYEGVPEELATLEI